MFLLLFICSPFVFILHLLIFIQLGNCVNIFIFIKQECADLFGSPIDNTFKIFCQKFLKQTIFVNLPFFLFITRFDGFVANASSEKISVSNSCNTIYHRKTDIFFQLLLPYRCPCLYSRLHMF